MRTKEKHNPYRKGVVFVSPSKADLVEGKGDVCEKEPHRL